MKKITFSFFIALNVVCSFSQITFNRSFKGYTANAVVQSGDDGYAFTGVDENYKMLIGKWDKYGKLLWKKTFGGNWYNSGNAIIATSDNNFIAVGDYQDYDTNYVSTYYFLVIKFDASGTILFEKKFGNPALYEYAASIKETTDGGYLFLGNDDDASYDYKNIVFTKFSSTGDSLWTKKYSGDYICYDMIKTYGNSLTLTGARNDSIFLMRVNETADSLWSIAYDLYSGDGTTLTTLQDSGLMIGSFDGMIIRTNKTGDTLWTRDYEDWGYWYPGNTYWKIAPTLDGNFVTAGTFFWDWWNYDLSATFLIKFKNNGDTIWTRFYDEPAFYNKAYCVQPTKDSGFIICGKKYDTSYTPLDTLIQLIKTDKNGLINTVNTPSICLITVDPKTEKNMIIWERQNTKGIEKYNIYNLSGSTWAKIGSVPYDSLSIYKDMSSSPATVSALYKISAVNFNTDELALSAAHRTIHLQTGLNPDPHKAELKWTKYLDSGNVFIPSYYYIYKGSSKTDLTHLIDSVSGVLDAYTDTSYDGISIYYQLSIRKPAPCSPAILKAESGPYTQSLSNIVEYKKVMLKEPNQLSASAFPNPVINNFTLQFEMKNASDVSIQITDAAGKVVYENIMKNQPAGANQIALSKEQCHLSAGTYLIKIIACDNNSILSIYCTN